MFSYYHRKRLEKYLYKQFTFESNKQILEEYEKNQKGWESFYYYINITEYNRDSLFKLFLLAQENYLKTYLNFCRKNTYYRLTEYFKFYPRINKGIPRFSNYIIGLGFNPDFDPKLLNKKQYKKFKEIDLYIDDEYLYYISSSS